MDTGLEIARDTFKSEQLEGVTSILNNTAITSFIRGLRNETIWLFLIKDNHNQNMKDFETAINLASRLEQGMINKSGQSTSSQPVIRDAKIYKTDLKNQKCYICNETGHLRKHCPRSRGVWSDSASHKEIRCSYCRKTGHVEARCYKKQNQQNTFQNRGNFSRNSGNQNYLNSKRARRGTAR